MNELIQFFTITVSKDHMTAELHYTDDYLVNRDIEITKEALQLWLQENNIVYGLVNKTIDALTSGVPELQDFPMTIAVGEQPKTGVDGSIHYTINLDPTIPKDDNWNFRDVLRIPSVETNQELAKITLPTEGAPGVDVFGKEVPAKPGKPVPYKAGKHVHFDEESLAFYADSAGQASVQGHFIHVHPEYQVSNTLSMKEGNIDFIGTIIIHGDVPSGYQVKAGGDIKIFGMVEAASIKADGSVYIAEGLSGLQKGSVEAGESVQIGYVNQGSIDAKKNLYVENSIIHSECIVGQELICQRGSIIGGHISAGEAIQVKNVGNHMNTRTELILGQNHKEVQKKEQLQLKKQEMEDTMAKLSLIGEKLSHVPNIQSNPKLLQTYKRQQASYEKNREQLHAIDESLALLSDDSNERNASLTVTGTIYANTVVTFGKYKRIMEDAYKSVQFELVRHEIFMRSLDMVHSN